MPCSGSCPGFGPGLVTGTRFRTRLRTGAMFAFDPNQVFADSHCPYPEMSVQDCVVPERSCTPRLSASKSFGERSDWCDSRCTGIVGSRPWEHPVTGARQHLAERDRGTVLEAGQAQAHSHKEPDQGLASGRPDSSRHPRSGARAASSNASWPAFGSCGSNSTG